MNAICLLREGNRDGIASSRFSDSIQWDKRLAIVANHRPLSLTVTVRLADGTGIKVHRQLTCRGQQHEETRFFPTLFVKVFMQFSVIQIDLAILRYENIPRLICRDRHWLRIPIFNTRETASVHCTGIDHQGDCRNNKTVAPHLDCVGQHSAALRTLTDMSNRWQSFKPDREGNKDHRCKPDDQTSPEADLLAKQKA